MPNLITPTTHSLFCALTNRYVYGLGLLYLEDSLGYPSFYHLDGLGSIRMITDDDTQVPEIEMYEVYDAYGNEGYSNSPPTSPLPSLRGSACVWRRSNPVHFLSWVSSGLPRLTFKSACNDFSPPTSILKQGTCDPVIDHTFTRMLICAILIFVRS